MTKETFLSDRDRGVIDLLHRFKVATAQDVREMVYGGISINHVYKGLKALGKAGLIKKAPFKQGAGRAFCLYSLTGKAFRKYVLTGQDDPDNRKCYRSDNPGHDLAILAFYKRLLKSPGRLGFIPENHLLTGSALVKSLGLEDWTRNHPDGLIVDEVKGVVHHLPLECELAIKTGFRYETKFYNYYRCDRIPAIIYLCKDARVRDILRRIELKYCDLYAPKIFYGLLDEVIASEGKMAFENRNGDTIKI